MKRRIACMLALATITSIIFFWAHQTVIGQNGSQQSTGLSDVTNGLLGWWPFDEGRGTNTFDASDNGRIGVLTGNPSPIWTAGVASNALEFDGIQNGVQVLDDGGISPTDALTLMTWVKVGTNATTAAI